MLTPFEPWHLLAASLAPEVAAQAFAGDNPAILLKLSEHDLAYTIVADDGCILGIAGAAPIGDGVVGEVFVVASEDRHSYPARFARDVRRVLRRARHRFVTIEAVGDNARWFDWLGFRNIAPGRWRLA